MLPIVFLWGLHLNNLQNTYKHENEITTDKTVQKDCYSDFDTDIINFYEILKCTKLLDDESRKICAISRALSKQIHES